MMTQQLIEQTRALINERLEHFRSRIEPLEHMSTDLASSQLRQGNLRIRVDIYGEDNDTPKIIFFAASSLRSVWEQLLAEEPKLEPTDVEVMYAPFHDNDSVISYRYDDVEGAYEAAKNLVESD